MLAIRSYALSVLFYVMNCKTSSALCKIDTQKSYLRDIIHYIITPSELYTTNISTVWAIQNKRIINNNNIDSVEQWRNSQISHCFLSESAEKQLKQAKVLFHIRVLSFEYIRYRWNLRCLFEKKKVWDDVQHVNQAKSIWCAKFASVNFCICII